jgi:predicted transcriptional regulator YdeE
MEVKIACRDAIAVLGVQERLTDMEEGVRNMWEVRFMAFHDRIAPLSTDGIYYGCAFLIGLEGTYDYVAGMAVPESTEVPDGLTLREVGGGPYAVVECTFEAMDDAFELIKGVWLPASRYKPDESRPVLDCYPLSVASGDSSMLICWPIVERAEG